MKKALLLALAVVFCFMLVGCGEKDNTNNGGEVNPPIINSGNVSDVTEPTTSGEEDLEVSGEVSGGVSGEVTVSGEASGEVTSGEVVAE